MNISNETNHFLLPFLMIDFQTPFFDQCGLLPFSTLVFLLPENSWVRKTFIESHRTFMKNTLKSRLIWLIYSHKLTTSKHFHFSPIK